jgi:hypothetical protein
MAAGAVRRAMREDPFKEAKRRNGESLQNWYRRLFIYVAGKLYWKIRPACSIQVGDEVGHDDG